MKKTVREWNTCTNCGACYNICPHNAITVEQDGLFYQPVIEEDKCVDCGICKTVCPVEKEHPVPALKGAWWGAHRDNSVVRTSSSGGAFSALAEFVLAQNGVVFGAAFSEDGRSVHMKSTEEVGMEALKRSKYVESQVGDEIGYRSQLQK